MEKRHGSPGDRGLAMTDPAGLGPGQRGLHPCPLLSFWAPSATPIHSHFPEQLSPLERTLRLPTRSLGWPDSSQQQQFPLLMGKIRSWQPGPHKLSSFHVDNRRESTGVHRCPGPSWFTRKATKLSARGFPSTPGTRMVKSPSAELRAEITFYI